jgi:hypothetical protein
MLRTLALLLLPLALLAAACGGDAGAPDPTATSASTGATATPSGADEPTPAGDSGASAVFDTLNPFDLLNAAGEAPASFGDADPALKSALLDAGDLPPGFFPLGDYSFSMPTEYGVVDMAAAMFVSGDLASDVPGPIVLSAAARPGPEALAALGDPRDLAGLVEEELGDLRSLSDEFGGLVRDLRLLDASGLGDGGVGVRMTMQLGELLGALGAPEEELDAVGEGLTIEMFLWMRGGYVLIVMGMWPGGGAPIDVRDLAERMDGRASF